MQLPFLLSPRQALVRALPWRRLRQLKLTDSGFGDAEAEVGAHPWLPLKSRAGFSAASSPIVVALLEGMKDPQESRKPKSCHTDSGSFEVQHFRWLARVFTAIREGVP